MSDQNDPCYLAGMDCTCGDCDTSTQIDKPGASPILGAMMNPTDSPLAHIPRPLMDAIDRAMTAAFVAGQHHPPMTHPIGNPDDLAATAEAEMWDALADYCLTHGWRV